MLVAINKSTGIAEVAFRKVRVPKGADPQLIAAYVCPECRESVTLKAGVINLPHFGHRNRGKEKGQMCPMSQGEGPDHDRIKKEIYDSLLIEGHHAILEHKLDSGHRTDIYVILKDGRRMCIEIEAQAHRRVPEVGAGKLYGGLPVLWILGSYDAIRPKTYLRTRQYWMRLQYHQFGAVYFHHRGMFISPIRFTGVKRTGGDEIMDSLGGTTITPDKYLVTTRRISKPKNAINLCELVAASGRGYSGDEVVFTLPRDKQWWLNEVVTPFDDCPPAYQNILKGVNDGLSRPNSWASQDEYAQ